MKTTSARFFDYTYVVVDLSNAIRRANLSISDLSGEGCMSGVEAIKDAALAFINADREIGFEWDGEWIEAVEDYAFKVAQAWGQEEWVSDDDYRRVAFSIIDDLVEKRGGKTYNDLAIEAGIL